MTQKESRILVVSELYYPEQTSTGHYMTRIAEFLGRDLEVIAICAQPTYSSRGHLAPRREVRNGVSIERCWTTRLNKDVLPFRVINAVTVAASLGLRVLARARRGDRVIVVTTPPLLPFKCWLPSRIRGATLTLLVHDVHPDVLGAARIVARGGRIARALGWAMNWLYARVDRIIVIGRDMAELVCRRASKEKIRIVTNFADTTEISAVDRTPGKPFVVQYSGNIGRTHGVEALLDVAALLKTDPDIRFVIAGSGGKKATVERLVAERGLTHVSVIPPVPRDELGAHLAAADLCVIALESGMYGVSVPSRMYNIMAAGRPILALVDRESEVWRVVDEERIGWAIEASAPAQEIARIIRKAASNFDELRAAGRRARAAAEAKYSESRVLQQFAAAIE